MASLSDCPGIAFAGASCIARGPLAEVALAAKKALAKDGGAAILIFDGVTGSQIDIDFRGSDADVVKRLAERTAPTGPAATEEAAEATGQEAEVMPRRPGRPKLGVIAREVTLLPRHWDWLAGQPGGASVALRKLVEAARRGSDDKDRLRRGQEAVYRFMSVMAGDRIGFEEASRALFAGNRSRFAALIAAWPSDIRDHIDHLAAGAFPG